MYDDYSKIREAGEDIIKREMANQGVDSARILAISHSIREVIDTGSSKEVAFLQAMLDACLTMLPYAYEQARRKDKDHTNPNDDIGFRPERG